VNRRAKVILVSAYSDMANIRTAMNRGAFDFLVKPVDFRDAAATLEKTVASVREARRTHVSAEENRVLRMFVSPTVLECVLPSVRAEASVLSAPASFQRSPGLGVADTRSDESTVVCVDVYGFTARVAGDNVDAALRRLNANFEVIAPELAARQGVVERFGGDELWAVFSGPHHRERALDAAVAVRAQLATMALRAGAESPYEHGVAIGVASGPVLAGTVGSQALSRFDHALLGEVVTRVADLKSAARRNEILVDESLHGALARAFSFRDLGARPMGADEARVWDVLGRNSGADDASASPPVDDALTATVTRVENDVEPARPPRAAGQGAH
jgi:class 3 adenylate cyclase